MKNKSPLVFLVWGLVLLLLILHQDNWFWDDKTLVLGFMPIGLLYHAGISVGAAITWYLATLFAWPEDIDAEATSGEKEAGQ